MSNERSPLQPSHSTVPKPYCAIGAGRLTSFLWKTGDEESGWHYRFNLFHVSAGSGRAAQLFAPSDLMDFVKFVQVMATVLSDDGCLKRGERRVLKRLASDLDDLLAQTKANARD